MRTLTKIKINGYFTGCLVVKLYEYNLSSIKKMTEHTHEGLLLISDYFQQLHILLHFCLRSMLPASCHNNPSEHHAKMMKKYSQMLVTRMFVCIVILNKKQQNHPFAHLIDLSHNLKQNSINCIESSLTISFASRIKRRYINRKQKCDKHNYYQLKVKIQIPYVK